MQSAGPNSSIIPLMSRKKQRQPPLTVEMSGVEHKRQTKQVKGFFFLRFFMQSLCRL